MSMKAAPPDDRSLPRHITGSGRAAPPSAHTAGPWEVCPSGYRVMSKPLTGYGRCICDTANNAKTRNAENAANARLIAAAPELAEGCQALVKWATKIRENWGTDLHPDRMAELAKAEEALKKAGLL